MIEQKKKLRLDELQVDSFVTSTNVNPSETIKGGALSAGVIDCVVLGTIIIVASIVNCSKPANGCPLPSGNANCTATCPPGGDTGDPNGCQYIV